MTEEPHRSRRRAIMKAHPEVSLSPLRLISVYYLVIGLQNNAQPDLNLYFVPCLDDANCLISWPVYDLDLLLRLTPHLGPTLFVQLNESILP
jgi:hypothetical protein